MDDLDDYGLTLTYLEVEYLLDVLEHDAATGGGQTARDLMAKITQQIGVQ